MAAEVSASVVKRRWMRHAQPFALDTTAGVANQRTQPTPRDRTGSPPAGVSVKWRPAARLGAERPLRRSRYARTPPRRDPPCAWAAAGTVKRRPTTPSGANARWSGTRETRPHRDGSSGRECYLGNAPRAGTRQAGTHIVPSEGHDQHPADRVNPHQPRAADRPRELGSPLPDSRPNARSKRHASGPLVLRRHLPCDWPAHGGVVASGLQPDRRDRRLHVLPHGLGRARRRDPRLVRRAGTCSPDGYPARLRRRQGSQWRWDGRTVRNPLA